MWDRPKSKLLHTNFSHPENSTVRMWYYALTAGFLVAGNGREGGKNTFLVNKIL
jgi:hypothetical protein